MRSKLLSAVALTALLTLPGCKLVKTDVEGEGTPAAGQAGDDARIAALLDETYDARLIPLLREKAVDFVALKTGIGDNLDKAGEQYGLRAGGAGGAWNFAIRATGKVIEENRKSKAATADMDIDGDGKPDLKLQLGPVVKGTALRDVAPSVYDFSAFRDQIEFAKLGRALNDKATSSLPESGALDGKTISVLGVAAIRSAGELPLLVPVETEISP